MQTRPESRVDGFVRWAGVAISAALPVAASVAHAPLVDDGAHDASLVRALGLGAVGLPSFDALIAAPLLVLPLGTFVFRLALASALATGAAGAALHLVARALVGRVLGEESARLAVAVATLASLAATLSRPWQAEASAPLASTISAAAVLALVAVMLRPGVFVTQRAVVGSIDGQRARGALRMATPLVLAALIAIAFWALRRARSELVFADVAPTVASAFDRARVAAFLIHYVGPVTSIGAAAGVVLAVISRPSRGCALALTAIALSTLACIAEGSAAGPERFDAVTLLASAFTNVFAGAAIASLVRWVARLRVPLASASAAMVAVLGAAFPAIALDESAIAADARAPLEAIDWATAALGDVRPGTVVIGDEPRHMQRLIASTLVGEAPSDLAFVPLYDVGGKLVRRQINRMPELVPLVRDLTLTGLPTELAMSKLAAERSVVLLFSARWERALARHLVPDAALDRFEPEPRGTVDRRKALEVSEPLLAPLARVLAGASAHTLASSTADLLRPRVLALATTGERELAFRVLEQMRAFGPTYNDSFIASMETRLRAKGAVSLGDLARR